MTDAGYGNRQGWGTTPSSSQWIAQQRKFIFRYLDTKEVLKVMCTGKQIGRAPSVSFKAGPVCQGRDSIPRQSNEWPLVLEHV